MTDATELDIDAVRARVEESRTGAGYWGACSHEWVRLDDMDALLAALDEAREQADSFAEQLLAERHDHERTRAALSEAQSRYAEMHEDWAGQCRITDRVIGEKLAAESALAAVREVLAKWDWDPETCHIGALHGEILTDFKDALATPTTTERSEG